MRMVGRALRLVTLLVVVGSIAMAGPHEGGRGVTGEGLPLVSDVRGAPPGVIGRFPGATGTTQWYGHLAKTPSGVLVYGYAYGGAQLRCRTSQDNGRTWSEFRAVHEVSTKHITGGATFGITSRGVWVFLFSEDTIARPYPKNMYLRYIRSTDGGVTWSVPGTIPTTMPFGITGGIAEFRDGTLISAYAEGFFGYRTFTGLYGDPANRDTTSIKVVKSTDGGATWGRPAVAYAHHDRIYQLNRPFLDEPAIAVDRRDHAVMICRTPDYGTGELTSIDHGATWVYSGIIGQTNCGPGVYSNNAAPCLLTVNDSTFMAVVGYRANADGPGTEAGKVGWQHILTGTWRGIQDATFGWSTFLPPTLIDYGDAAAHRAVIARDGVLVMVQMQGGRVYRLTEAEVRKARASWPVPGGRTKFSRTVWDTTLSNVPKPWEPNWTRAGAFSFLTPPPRDPKAVAAIGAIPDIVVGVHFTRGGTKDTAWVRLTDANGITMPSNGDSLASMFVCGRQDRKAGGRTWFPTRLRDASGNVVLGQFEKRVAPVYVEVRSTRGAVVQRIDIHMGYMYK